jgi:hypothetical protein
MLAGKSGILGSEAEKAYLSLEKKSKMGVFGLTGVSILCGIIVYAIGGSGIGYILIKLSQFAKRVLLN